MIRVSHRAEVRPEPPPGALVTQVRISPDGARVAFVVIGGDAPGVYVARCETPDDRLRLVDTADLRAEGLAWSPDGARLAYALVDPRTEPATTLGVAWAGSATPGELGRAAGLSFAWTPKGNALIVADPEQKAIARADVLTGRVRGLASLSDDGDPLFAPRIAVSPDGTRFAFTCRRAGEDLHEVWLVTRETKGTTTELLTEVPGAEATVLPFWSPKGRDLGLFIIHAGQEKTILVIVPRCEGEGELLYDVPLYDPAVTPTWTPSGRSIALFHVPAERYPGAMTGPSELVFLPIVGDDPRPLDPVTQAGDLEGALHFIDAHRLAVDGGSTGHLLTLADPA